MTQITLLTQPDCDFCDHAKRVLGRLSGEFALTVTEIDLSGDTGRKLAAENAVLFAPGLLVDGQLFSYGRLSERKLRKTLTRTATTQE